MRKNQDEHPSLLPVAVVLTMLFLAGVGAGVTTSSATSHRDVPVTHVLRQVDHGAHYHYEDIGFVVELVAEQR